MTTTGSTEVRIDHVKKLQGVYRPPADKSISHRALILSAIAHGRSLVSPISRSADVASTAACLRQLGVDIQEHEGTWVVNSPGIDNWIAPERALDCGNSGTTMRLLAGCLAHCAFPSTLIGDESLMRRPMLRVAEPLRRMGATITLSAKNTAPLEIRGGSLTGITFELPVPSAQVKSAVLLAGLAAAGECAVIETVASRDHTERMLGAAGVDCIIEHPQRPTGDKRELILAGLNEPDAPGSRRTVRLGGKRTVTPLEWTVPGDFSAAAFVIAAAIGSRKSEIIIDNVGINPTRTGLLRVLKRMGVDVDVKKLGDYDGEPYGQIHVRECGTLKPVKIHDHEIPSLIDELPVIAVLAARAEGISVLRGASELRTKESDRIAAVASNLRAMGAKVAEVEDGWAIEGPTEWHGSTIDPLGDHRIAMAFAVAALWADTPSTVRNAGIMGVSDPDFLSSLIALSH
jgi:3-phosphoshikimate 1-carboxyvinyltransferase